MQRKSPKVVNSAANRASRSFVSEWTPHTEMHRHSTIRDTGRGQGRKMSYQPRNAVGIEDNTYEAIRDRCLRNRSLWTDPEFPPTDSSLFYSTPPQEWSNIRWKRPTVRSSAQYYRLY